MSLQRFFPIASIVPAITAIFAVQVPQDAAAKKIDSLATLRAGWHYGSGKPIASYVLNRLSELNDHAQRLAITQTDVFPGQDGDATIAIYRGDEDFYFRVQADGSIEFGSEWGNFEDPQTVTWQDALNCLRTLASLDSWKSFSFSTSETTMLERGDSGVPRSKGQVTGAASQFLVTIAQSTKQAVFVLMPVNTTRVSLPNHLSIGSSILLSFQKVMS